jgi:hypothetical protein
MGGTEIRCRYGDAAFAGGRVGAGFEHVGERIKRSKFAATSDTAISRCARLFGTRERQSVMLATLLIIVASIAAGMIVNRVHPEYRKW